MGVATLSGPKGTRLPEGIDVCVEVCEEVEFVCVPSKVCVGILWASGSFCVVGAKSANPVGIIWVLTNRKAIRTAKDFFILKPPIKFINLDQISLH